LEDSSFAIRRAKFSGAPYRPYRARWGTRKPVIKSIEQNLKLATGLVFPDKIKL
jgi:hypothetical protein